MLETLLHTDKNILGGVGFAILSVIIGTNIFRTGIKDYILILIIAILGTASIIETWFLDKSFITSCLIGFSIGLLVDDIYLNIRDTAEEHMRGIIDATMDGIKERIRRFIGGD